MFITFVINQSINHFILKLENILNLETTVLYYNIMNNQNTYTPHTIISKETIKRLSRDIRENLQHPLSSNGIYYKHSDTDLLSGIAMIIGPENTPYHNGFFFFNFKFPIDYPYTPPTVTFISPGYNVRFHPNFYRNGKVCVSILNTWHGEQWSSCYSLNNILTTLLSMFIHNSPLLLEPIFNESDIKQQTDYNNVIHHATINSCICDFLNNTPNYETVYPIFNEICTKHFLEHYQEIITAVTSSKKNITRIHIPVYDMKYKIDYSRLFVQLKFLYNRLDTK